MTVIPHVFFNGDVPLAAHVHRDGSDLVSRQPAVLVTGSWLTVKEQMADHYARALAQHGFTAITFDFAGFGASGGTPRQAEIPERKIADIATVARQVSRLSFIQPGVVGHLAICAPPGPTRWPKMSWQYWLTFNGLSSAPKVTVDAIRALGRLRAARQCQERARPAGWAVRAGLV